MIEVFAAGATVDEVEGVISSAVPSHLPPAAVLAYSVVPGGVRVRAGEPVSPMQRAALDAVRERWPDVDLSGVILLDAYCISETL